MKRIFKTIVNVLAVFMLGICCFSFTACSEDIRVVEVKIQAYDKETEALYDKDLTLTINLYRHLAPKTVDTIISYIQEGYYNDTVFYYEDELVSEYTIYVGEYLMNNDQVVKNTLKPEIYGEFESNATVGSDLANEKGSVGLWRSWYKADTISADYRSSSNARNSGRATWFMPTSTKSSFDGYFCVFGQIDFDNEANAEALSAIKGILDFSTYYTKYTVYYTGTYDPTKPNEDYGLEFHCCESEDFKKNEIENLFETQKGSNQLIQYDYHEIKVPNVTAGGESMAKIKTVTVK